MPSQTEWTRVVVLTPSPNGGAGPVAAGPGASVAASAVPAGVTDDLKSQFAQRDWFAVEQHDPFLAMAELCLRDRAQATRASWGLQRMEQLALVVVNPQQWSLLNNMVDAVRRFVPVATVWTVTDGEIVPLGVPVAIPKIGRIAPVDRATQAAVPVRQPILRSTAPAAVLHLVEVDDDEGGAANGHVSGPVAGQVSGDVSGSSGGVSGNASGGSGGISREEIEMLLHADGQGEPA